MPHHTRSMKKDGKVKKQKQQVPNLPKDKAKVLTKDQSEMHKERMRQEKQRWRVACKVLIILSRRRPSSMKGEKILNASQSLTKLPENRKMSNLLQGLAKRAKNSSSTTPKKPTLSSKRRTRSHNSSLSLPIPQQPISNTSWKLTNSKRGLPPVAPKV